MNVITLTTQEIIMNNLENVLFTLRFLLKIRDFELQQLS